MKFFTVYLVLTTASDVVTLEMPSMPACERAVYTMGDVAGFRPDWVKAGCIEVRDLVGNFDRD